MTIDDDQLGRVGWRLITPGELWPVPPHDSTTGRLTASDDVGGLCGTPVGDSTCTRVRNHVGLCAVDWLVPVDHR